MVDNRGLSADIKRRLLSLAERAMRCDLTFDELSRTELPPRGVDPFVDIFVDDLEDAVQHVPSDFLSPAVDVKRWRDDWDFLWLYLDYAVLKSAATTDRLVELRRVIAAERPRDTADVDRRIHDLLS